MNKHIVHRNTFYRCIPLDMIRDSELAIGENGEMKSSEVFYIIHSFIIGNLFHIINTIYIQFLIFHFDYHIQYASLMNQF